MSSKGAEISASKGIMPRCEQEGDYCRRWRGRRNFKPCHSLCHFVLKAQSLVSGDAEFSNELRHYDAFYMLNRFVDRSLHYG